MRMQARSWVLGLTLLLCCPPAALRGQSPELRRLADAVDKHYNGLTSLEANFSESFRGGGLARSESGKSG